MLVPNINRFYSTVFEKLNNKFSWPLMGSNVPEVLNVHMNEIYKNLMTIK